LSIFLAIRFLHTKSKACEIPNHSFFRDSFPLGDHGKCQTGIIKKLLLESAIPAKAAHQARNAANSAKNPPALRIFAFGSSDSSRRKYPMARRRKAISTEANSEQNMTVDLSVQRNIRKVNINQPYRVINMIFWLICGLKANSPLEICPRNRRTSREIRRRLFQAGLQYQTPQE